MSSVGGSIAPLGPILSLKGLVKRIREHSKLEPVDDRRGVGVAFGAV